MKAITHNKNDGQAQQLAETETLVTAENVGKALNLHKRTVALHAQNGSLPHYRLGGSIRFKMSEVWETVKRGRLA